MITHFQKFFMELAREGGRDCGVVSMTVTEPLYKRLVYEAFTDRRMYNTEANWDYGTPVCYYFYSYRVEIKPDTVDKELKEIWNGDRKVCW